MSRLSELKTLSEVDIPTERVFVKIHFPLKKISDDPFVVAGYASIEQIDKQSEKIPVPVLKEAWDRCFKGQVRTHLMHTSIPVGDVIDKFIEENGTVHVSGMDDVGLYIVSKVWDNTKKAMETRQLITEQKLTAYSIGGEALGEPTLICHGEVCYNQINRMDFHEISYVDKPANPDCILRILKRDNGEVELPNIIQIDKELLQKPIPKPRSGEEQDKYISRCVSAIADADPEMENKQRVAICFNTWRESKKGESTLLGDLIQFTHYDLFEKIQKFGTPIEELYDVFLVRRETKSKCEKCEVAKKSELSDGAIQSDDVVNASRQEVDSAGDPSYNAESKTKISVKVKLHGD